MGLEGNVDGRVEADPELLEALEKLQIDRSILDPTDPEFVVDPEFRPKTKHDDFFESAEEQIPLIDLQSLREGDEEGIRKVVDQIGSAAEHWGFFQVINHGVALSLVDNLEKEALKFFSLPLEEKKKITRTIQRPTGYFHQEYTKEHRDWKEVFDWKLRSPTPSDSDVFSTRYNLQNQWPEEPASFREACEKYAKATEGLAFELLKLITRSLGLPEDRFIRYFEPYNAGAVRLNYYPPCPIPGLALGVSRHRDGGALTVLVQDETGGLQVRGKNGQWIGVRPRRDAFVINIGDLFQVWTNKKYRSIEHQVVVNENKARFSFPLFLSPAPTTDISPVPELLNGELPKYSTYNYGYFIRRRTAGNIEQLGKNLQIDDYEINS